MRKYTGKYPNAIREISGSFAPGIALIKTNNGAAYFLRAKDTNGIMPRVGADIFDYKFTRAQPMTFEQEVTRFHRILDGYALPFAEYLAPDPAKYEFHKLDTLESYIRRNFVHDMARQGVLPRFTDDRATLRANLMKAIDLTA